MKIKHSVTIKAEWHIVEARTLARKAASELGFAPVDQARIIVAISELARNIYTYAGQGEISISSLETSDKSGLHIDALDHGPGMDLSKVMQDGFSTSGGLGVGLPGVKRLMDEFAVASSPNEGTRVSVTKWL